MFVQVLVTGWSDCQTPCSPSFFFRRILEALQEPIFGENGWNYAPKSSVLPWILRSSQWWRRSRKWREMTLFSAELRRRKLSWTSGSSTESTSSKRLPSRELIWGTWTITWRPASFSSVINPPSLTSSSSCVSTFTFLPCHSTRSKELWIWRGGFLAFKTTFKTFYRISFSRDLFCIEPRRGSPLVAEYLAWWLIPKRKFHNFTSGWEKKSIWYGFWLKSNWLLTCMTSRYLGRKCLKNCLCVQWIYFM